MPTSRLFTAAALCCIFVLPASGQVSAPPTPPGDKPPVSARIPLRKKTDKLGTPPGLMLYPFRNIQVERKAGQQTGPAVVVVGGKRRRVASGAYQALPLEKGQDALILIKGRKQQAGTVHLLYVEGATKKRRDLGVVPFSSATLAELKATDGSPAFLLSGDLRGRPQFIVADVNGVHGRVEGSVIASASPREIAYRDNQSGQTRSTSINAFVAEDLEAIYTVPTLERETLYAQFLRDGTVLLEQADGSFQRGKWWTNGVTMNATFKNGTHFEWPRTALGAASGVPAGTRLDVRLSEALASQTVKVGDPVNAVLVSPASVAGKIYLPQGTVFRGSVTHGHGVGWGFKHETAALTVEFQKATLPDGETVRLHTRLYQVDNAQEKVNDQGNIQGVRSTGTIGHSAESKVASIASFDPVAYLFANATATGTLGFAEPEILYSAGTEFIIELNAPLLRDKTFPQTIPAIASSLADQDALAQFTRDLPFRTMTQGSNKPSDITNLIFIGPEDGLRRAFEAAGWNNVDPLTAGSAFQTVKTLAGNQTYREAPMSMLLLDERPPIFTLTKTTNTFSSRHHIRVFDPGAKYNGVTAYTASSTQDIGVGFSSAHKTFIHIIDQHIDNERSKVVNDLVFTGCVQAVDLVPRAWVPLDAYNSTGDRLRTDGAVVILRMSDCSMPRSIAFDPAEPPARVERVTRNVVLTLRNDILRGNLVYQGVSGAITLRNYLLHKDDLKPDAGAWRKADLSGTKFRGTTSIESDLEPSEYDPAPDNSQPARSSSSVAQPLPEISHRWDPPRYEISLRGGYLRYPTLHSDAIAVSLTPLPDQVGLASGFALIADEVDGGWTAGISVTLNTWRWVSNEFAYQYQLGRYRYLALNIGSGPDDGLQTKSSGLATRQFEYNVLVHARPPESRWRPYLAAGPVLQLLSLTDTTLKKPAGPFRLGLQNIGVLKSAFDFGSTPPLDGGGIYQLGVQYGGGMKVRVLPRITVRADFRETLSPNPHFLRDDYTTAYFDSENYSVVFDRAPPTSRFRQQRVTVGIGFTF